GIDLRLHGTESDDETIKDTALAQPLLVASAIACAAELGISPGVVAGHSVGEIAAAQIAGILTAADAMRFVSVRGQGMASAAATQLPPPRALPPRREPHPPPARSPPRAAPKPSR